MKIIYVFMRMSRLCKETGHREHSGAIELPLIEEGLLKMQKKYIQILRLVIALLVSQFSFAEATTSTQSLNPSATAVTTGAAGQSTAQMSNLQESRWGVNYWGIASVARPNEFETKMKMYSESDTKTFTYSYLSLNYKLSNLEKMSLRAPFIYMSVRSGEMKYIPLDWFVSYSRYGLASLGEVQFAGGLRLYVPTSQQSQDSKMLFGFRTEMSARIKADTWKWTYYFKPDFYLYEKNEYLDVARGNRPVATKMIKLEHYIEGEKALNRLFGFRPYLGFEDNWYNAADKRTGTNLKTDLVARLGLDINLSRKFNIGLGVENRTSVTHRSQPWIPLASEDNSLFLITYAEI